MTLSDQQCLDEGEILAVASAPPDSRPTSARTSSHLATCVVCRREVEQMRRGQQALYRLLDPVVRANLDSVSGSVPRSGQNRSAAALLEKVRAADVPKKPAGPQEQVRLRPGQRLGKYPIRQFLGRGGLSEVYLVTHPELEIVLAAKICRLDENSLRGNSGQWQKEALLRQEAATLARLSDSRTIARVYDMGFADGIGPFVVMEYVRARNLRQCWQEYAHHPARAVELMSRIGHAVGEAHAQGIVHGDLKPENVLVDERGDIKLIDFGMARIRDAWELGQGDEVDGGTPGYMAPEQAAGQTGLVQSSSDVYALGAMLLELVTGKRPGESWTEDRTMTRLKSVVEQCLAHDPSRRFATGKLFAEALATSWPVKKSAGPSVWFLAVMAGLALLAALVGYLWWKSGVAAASSSPTGPIPGLLQSDDSRRVGINQMLPLEIGRAVSVSAVVPADLNWYVVWIDSARKVEVFSPASGELALETQPVGDGREARLYWPRPTEDSVVLGGTGGSEMVMLVGVRRNRADFEGDLVKTIEQAIGEEGAWPAISPDLYIRCSRDDVQAGSAEGVQRSVEASTAKPDRHFEKTVQRLRIDLRDQCDFLLGEAFCVMTAESAVQPPETSPVDQTPTNWQPDEASQPAETAPVAPIDGPGPVAASGHSLTSPVPGSDTTIPDGPAQEILQGAGGAAAVGQTTSGNQPPNAPAPPDDQT